MQEDLDKGIILNWLYGTYTACTLTRKFLKGMRIQNRRTNNSRRKTYKYFCDAG
jgi:hypothetical protein